MTIGKSKSAHSGKKVEAPDSDDDDEFDNNLDRYPQRGGAPQPPGSTGRISEQHQTTRHVLPRVNTGANTARSTRQNEPMKAGVHRKQASMTSNMSNTSESQGQASTPRPTVNPARVKTNTYSRYNTQTDPANREKKRI